MRIAGPHVVATLAGCFLAEDGQPLTEYRLPECVRGKLKLAELGAREVPCELYLWPTARSYCRSPMAEIHTLGSPPLLATVLRTVCAGGVRAAEPGEFTLRAFLGGRIDLAQAEAVLGVIDAPGQQEFQVALEQLSGGLSHPLSRLREELLELLAHLEAGLDFVEEDIDFISASELEHGLAAALIQVESLAAQMTSRTEASSVPRVVLRGLPNAGKSSLLNAMVERYGTDTSSARQAALVSPQPGTTRDYLTVRLSLEGMECELIDTAGLDEGSRLAGPDRDAQGMTRQQIARADVEIHCLDASQPDVPSMLPENQTDPSVLIALTKCDLPRRIESANLSEACLAIQTSATNGVGLLSLADAIRAALGNTGKHEAAIVAATAQRCRDSLMSAAASLREAQRLVSAGGVEELLAAEIRAALNALGNVTGAIYTDDILDRVFSRFCIGK
ncbi:MAG: 50S ribosome-binding GTPase [Planctomycetes bacterium]|nr:50S ribosome-binding GTPase [Planctomycetota bacterium]